MDALLGATRQCAAFRTIASVLYGYQWLFHPLLMLSQGCPAVLSYPELLLPLAYNRNLSKNYFSSFKELLPSYGGGSSSRTGQVQPASSASFRHPVRWGTAKQQINPADVSRIPHWSRMALLSVPVRSAGNSTARPLYQYFKDLFFVV